MRRLLLLTNAGKPVAADVSLKQKGLELLERIVGIIDLIKYWFLLLFYSAELCQRYVVYL